MAKISELPILTEPGTPTRFLAVDVSTAPYSSKTVTLADLRDKIISLGVIDIGSTLVQNLNGSFDVATPIPSQTGYGGSFLTTNGSVLSWATLNSTFPSQTGNNGKYLTTDGTNVSWASLTNNSIPEQVNRAGQYLTTNGTTASWVAIGASLLASQTGNASALLTTNGTTSSWVKLGASLLPSQTGNTSSVLITNGTTSSWVKIGASLLPSQTGNTGSFLITNGTTSSWTKLTLSSLTNVVLSSPTAGQSLIYNGTNWVNSTTNASGLSSRATFSTSTSVISSGTTANVTISNAYKGYILYKIAVTTSSWVRIYTDVTSRAADASRASNTDPTPGAGIIAEVITTGSQTILISPGAYGFNNESVPTTTIPMNITNLSGSAVAITATLTVLQLEV